MRGQGRGFAPSANGKFNEHRVYDAAGNLTKGVAVEEEKGGAAVALPQEFYGFCEGEDL